MKNNYIIKLVFCSVSALCVIACGDRAKYPEYFRYAGSIAMDREQMAEVYGVPNDYSEWLFSMCNAAFDSDWDKLSRLTAVDKHEILETYFHNLANAMKGCLADSLMYYYQPFEKGLLPDVDSKAPTFGITQVIEAWYRLGSMTMAEHATMLSMSFNPPKTGTRYLERLADINLINGDSAAVEKYAGILGKYPEWTEEKRQIQARIPATDIIHAVIDPRAALRNLVESNHSNTMAYEYLLCYDLLTKDLVSFIKDYDSSMPSSRLFEEAALLYLAQNKRVSAQSLEFYSISEQTFRDFVEYDSIYRNDSDRIRTLQEKFFHTYWYYFNFATRNEKE